MITAEEARKNTRSEYEKDITQPRIQVQADLVLKKIESEIICATKRFEHKTSVVVEFDYKDWTNFGFENMPISTCFADEGRKAEIRHHNLFINFDKSASDFMREVNTFGNRVDIIMYDFRKLEQNIVMTLQKNGYKVKYMEGYFCCLFEISWE